MVKCDFITGQQKPMDQKDKLKEMASKTKVFAAQLRGMPDFIAVFKLLANLRLLLCMIVALVMGAGIGIISTFLFWHLQVMQYSNFKKYDTVFITKVKCDKERGSSVSCHQQCPPGDLVLLAQTLGHEDEPANVPTDQSDSQVESQHVQKEKRMSCVGQNIQWQLHY